jgi:agmatinase
MEPAMEWGIHTLPPLALDLGSPESAVQSVASAVRDLASTGKLVAVLGGEHALSAGVAKGLADVHGELAIVQLDAHADLRESYEGTRYSHACAGRRMLEAGRLFQLGIRSLDITEAAYLRDNPSRVTCIHAEAMRQDRSYLETLAEFVKGKPVFLTMDVDVFDPSLMPSTGTPEPGGLFWYDVLEIVRAVAAGGKVVGFDCVELSPIPGLHAPDFMAAKLVYKTLGLVLSRRAAG